MLLLSIALFFSGISAANASGVMGDWIGPTQSVIRIHRCGSEVCVKIVKLSSAAPSKIDDKNPDSGLRSRPLCGLDIGTGFHQVDQAHLQDGRLYDPKSGHTYSGTIVADGDQLNLHGYIGISMLGRTEVWHRVPAADDKSCGKS